MYQIRFRSIDRGFSNISVEYYVLPYEVTREMAERDFDMLLENDRKANVTKYMYQLLDEEDGTLLREEIQPNFYSNKFRGVLW